ncbi:MAG: hypothetical protein HUJ56_12645 [Erysipelotrichaceae bacterium]|nr:hypothetical protein [Erysipelotrichaceae bacterium]
MIETEALKENDVYYYRIHISYEIPYNVLDSDDQDIIRAKDILYDRLRDSIPEKYERFSVKLVLSQLKDSLNYIVTYTSFFKSPKGLPMEEYVEARSVKEKVEREIEEFFQAIDCEYHKLNIKSFN